MDFDLNLPVLPDVLLDNVAAEFLVDHLHAVADPEDRQANPEEGGVVGRGIVGVDGLGSSRHDDRLEPGFLQLQSSNSTRT